MQIHSVFSPDRLRKAIDDPPPLIQVSADNE
jgi:hypothetical protein